MSKHKLDEWLHVIGHVTDAEAARIIGCDLTNITTYRHRHNIPPVSRRGRAKEGPQNRRRTLSVDPGVKKAGVALWVNSTLVKSTVIITEEGELAKAIIEWAGTPLPANLIVEKMTRYHRLRSTWADLDRIDQMIGELEKAFTSVVKIQAFGWKGNAPKEVIRDRLLAQGLGSPQAPHDEMDAIGIGAVGLMILGRGCTTPRDRGEEE